MAEQEEKYFTEQEDVEVETLDEFEEVVQGGTSAALNTEESQQEAESPAEKKGPKRGKHSKGEPEPPEYIKRSRRMRKILLVIIIALVILIVAGCVLTYMLVDTARNAASQQALTSISDVNSLEDGDEAKDASTSTSKRTTVPDLVSLLGMNLDQVVAELQHGAQVSGMTEVNEEGNPVKMQVSIALSDEPADTRSGTPSVYLDLDEAGNVIKAGYSVATASIGYGTLSFADAVQNERIIEKTIEEAGLTVANQSAVLPEDKMAYSTYASDGTTLTREYCEFSGTGSAGGAEYTWQASLSYDYNMANATGNLADTIRTIYVYVSA
ncbi:histone-lysine N-methyltransferase [Adlercreutzia sp. ZJ304]|uniref:histone-lysine N-methyltransferase n=1 Tax=Adlercreutzia sp. ZJ304 TaxID=2709791 RepID=UPI0013E9ADFA|nr:histone-lysine N-methyltransferase [Adlercreutzia sp. ZJ304]